MDKYRDYTNEDFLQDRRFQLWIISGTQEQNAFWEEFLNRYPAQKNTLLTARATFKALHQLQDTATTEQGYKMWESIRNEMAAENPVKMRRVLISKVLSGWITIATAAMIILYFGWYILNPSANGKVAGYQQLVRKSGLVLVERINETDKPQRIQLPDRSFVLLQPHGRLSFQSHFEPGKREVFLTGTAYFNVTKDNKRPFVVYADQLVVKVVGTSFTIKSSGVSATSNVSVETGKVKVFSIEKYNGLDTEHLDNTILLTPNQQVSFDSGTKQFSKGLVSSPAVIAGPEAVQDFNFRKVSVNHVFQTLERAYGVRITCDQETIAHCNLTAQLGNEPLFRKLDIICQTIGAKYEVWGTEIIVSGGNCNH